MLLFVCLAAIWHNNKYIHITTRKVVNVHHCASNISECLMPVLLEWMVAVVFVFICNYIHPSMTFLTCIFKPSLYGQAAIYNSAVLCYFKMLENEITFWKEQSRNLELCGNKTCFVYCYGAIHIFLFGNTELCKLHCFPKSDIRLPL